MKQIDLKKNLIPVERIERLILLIRGRKVILDKELASLYGVTTSNLNKAVKRNIDRFPTDFIFQLTSDEYKSLRFQFGILKRGSHSKYLPYAFTEQGVAMLSSVLHSKRAVQVNIEIMRAFIRLRLLLQSHVDLELKLAAMERKYDAKFRVVFEAIKQLMAPPEDEPPRRQIGFSVREKQVKYRTKKR